MFQKHWRFVVKGVKNCVAVAGADRCGAASCGLPSWQPCLTLRPWYSSEMVQAVVVMSSLTGHPTKLNLPELLRSLRLCREIAITQVII